jgi:hypothetical protein
MRQIIVLLVACFVLVAAAPAGTTTAPTSRPSVDRRDLYESSLRVEIEQLKKLVVMLGEQNQQLRAEVQQLRTASAATTQPVVAQRSTRNTAAQARAAYDSVSIGRTTDAEMRQSMERAGWKMASRREYYPSDGDIKPLNVDYVFTFQRFTARFRVSGLPFDPVMCVRDQSFSEGAN